MTPALNTAPQVLAGRRQRRHRDAIAKFLLPLVFVLGGEAWAEPKVFTCQPAGILDGDTLRCSDGVRVRLWGIQAPESHEPGGPASTRALDRLTRGRSLTCRRKGASWNRVVAQCFAGSADVAAEMVRQGQAVDWPAFSKGFYARPK